ncbi:hypothetical protein GK107_14445 [Geobacillus thermoleovorans]|uniref:hypothetical protein n=1 Tax=Geobacillus thermoleovorans TaxID=33941 RepID=UPI0020713A91|nr:hypothetical protein [Geobacillus thermoleovorans]UPT60485.1 hypothetical protein GK107_14445 [Geobacillus thermoleovorans]
MKNRYEYISDETVRIYALKHEKEEVGFLISAKKLELFDKATNGYWRLQKKDGRYQVLTHTNGKVIRAARLAAGIVEDRSKYVYIANGDELDLRDTNLVIYKGGNIKRTNSQERIAGEISEGELGGFPNTENSRHDRIVTFVFKHKGKEYKVTAETESEERKFEALRQFLNS